MQLMSLQADRLRNLRAVAIELPAGLSVLVGRNGEGKTSVLEAAYLLATGRSFRTRRLPELVAWNGGPLKVGGTVREAARGESRLAVVVDGAERRLSVDGAEAGLESYLGRLDLIALPGEWMRVLREEPEERRRFLDRGIAGLDPSYLRILAEYRRVLLQRNALLRSPRRGGDGAELDAWDERLVEAGSGVHRRRREYAVRLASRMGEPGRALFDADEVLSLHYRPSPPRARDEAADGFAGVFREALRKGRGRDVSLGFTGDGPHRDDLAVTLDGADLRKYGSAGQVRSAMIALKLSKLELLREDRRGAPLFLMDDFDSDLDERRSASVVDFLAARGAQAVLATSKESTAGALGASCRRIRVAGGDARVE